MVWGSSEFTRDVRLQRQGHCVVLGQPGCSSAAAQRCAWLSSQGLAIWGFSGGLWRGGSPGGASGKEPACQCRRHKRSRFDPWVGKIPWRRKWQPTPVFLPGRIPWIEEPGGLQPVGSQRVRHDWASYGTAWGVGVGMSTWGWALDPIKGQLNLLVHQSWSQNIYYNLSSKNKSSFPCDPASCI